MTTITSPFHKASFRRAAARVAAAFTALVAFAAFGAFTAQPSHAAPQPSPVVVELFTSQGCSSCPPADALLRQMTGDRNIIALSHHVDYWDYLGWRDPFSSKQASQRQRRYTRALGLWSAYTPQMVINGRHNVSGGRRTAVIQQIGLSAYRDGAARIDVRVDGDQAHLSIPAGEASSCVIWQAEYDSLHITPVKRGENSGATLENANVVRAFHKIGEWEGDAASLTLDLADLREKGRDGVAILVQENGVGPVRAAAAFNINQREALTN